MGGKKQPGRFTIQFNLSDPQQRQVIELLNEQGRRSEHDHYTSRERSI